MSEKIDAEELLRAVNIVDIIGKRISLTKRGAEWYGVCPFHDDKKASLQVNEKKQIFSCFACDGKVGGDAIAFLMQYGATFHEACAELRGEIVDIKANPQKHTPKPKAAPPWKQIAPPSPPTDISHYKHGKPFKVWAYRTAAGKVIGYVCRFNLPDGAKDVIPYIFATDGKRQEWRWQGFEKPRPLYNLHILEQYKERTVLIVEGEKTAEAAAKLIPTAAVTCWIGGAQAIGEADWTPLHGRKIILWPDNDKNQRYGEKHEKAGQLKPFYEQPGNSAMLEIEAILKPHCSTIRWVKNSPEFPDKWDVADATDWTPETATGYVRANMYERGAEPPQDEPAAPPAAAKPQAPTPAPVTPPPAEEAPEDEPAANDMPFKFLGFDKSESGGQRFYFYVRNSGTVFSYSASSLSKTNLMTLAPLHWLEGHFMNKTGLDLDAAQSFIIGHGSKAGPFDERKIRGRGAWVEGENVILHGGDKLIVNGKNAPLREYKSKFIYEAGRELGFNIENALSAKEAHRFMDVVGGISWERPINRYLFAGWCILAPICGALKWRPHIWLTGGAGTGKSWVFKSIVRRMLGECALAVQSETTEAGIRQILGHDALPIVFDEAEGNERRDSDRIQTILNLMRAASAEDGGIMAKGSAGGTAKTYRIRSCFAFASISVGVYLQSDRSRVSVLGLVSEQDKALKEQKWKDLKKVHREVITDKFCDRMRARTIALLPTIIKNAETFADAVAFELGEQRAGDQLGALLAGAYSLTSDGVISYADACKWVKAKDWAEEKTNEGQRDEMQLFAYLMEQMTRIEAAGAHYERNIGEIVNASLYGEPAIFLEKEKAEDRLKRLGFRVDTNYVTVSNTADWIKKALINTQWSKNHNKILQRIPGAMPVDSVRFGSGVPCRGVKIPIDLVIGKK